MEFTFHCHDRVKMKIEAFYLRSEGGNERFALPTGAEVKDECTTGGSPGKNAEKGDSLHLTHHEKDQCSAGQ